jgi:SAM-dependent methyltransferase
MEEWYHRLADSPQSAAGCFTSDYVPFGGLLGSLSGTVLDLGGGNGVARHYLPARVRYVVVDPSLEWLGSEWAPVGEWFPCLASRPYFVQGVGERLPFRAHAFDAVLSFWSLNHVERPGEVFQEVARVLRPGGRFLAVLEDMEPRWRDLLPAPVGARGPGRKAALFAKKAARSLRGKPWDLQSDHLRISESDLQDWGEPDLAVTARTWVGQYLTYEFRKR